MCLTWGFLWVAVAWHYTQCFPNRLCGCLVLAARLAVWLLYGCCAVCCAAGRCAGCCAVRCVGCCADGDADEAGYCDGDACNLFFVRLR